MKERCGVSVAGSLLLLCICGNSNTQSIRSIVGNLPDFSGPGEYLIGSGSRERRESGTDLSLLPQLAAPGSGGGPRLWQGRSAGPVPEPAAGRGDINQHLTIGVLDGDRSAADQSHSADAGQVRPTSAAAETVLGFETRGQRVVSKGVSPSGAQPPGEHSIPGVEQQMVCGGSRSPQCSPEVSPARQLDREDISIVLDAVPASGRTAGSHHARTPGHLTSQTGLGQSWNGAVAGRSGSLSVQQRRAEPLRQPSRDAVAGSGARSTLAETAEARSIGRGRGAHRRQQQQQRAEPARGLPWSVPGQAGLDYPVLNRLPQPGVDCGRQDADGFYADMSDQSNCQAFWVCHNEEKDGFLCPNGTIFNQRYLACDWWFNVRCEDSPQYYELNKNIGVLGTRLNSQATPAPSWMTADVHPVLTLLHDILQYPRVPPVLLTSSAKDSDDSPPVHSAAQPALPSRNQYSNDSFHAHDKWSVRVSGGIPGTPPKEKHGAGQLSKEVSHEAMGTAVKTSEGQRLSKRFVKRHISRAKRKHSKRYPGKKHGSQLTGRREVREHNMIQEAERRESAASVLAADIRHAGQSASVQPRKRAPEPSSGAAFTSIQEAAASSGQPSVGPGGAGPLLQTVDKVAFPMDVEGPDFPKVEEDFNVQEASGLRKSTSIKDVLPSQIDIPQSDVVKVMAASGSQQTADSNAGPLHPLDNQASITDLSGSQNSGIAKNYAGISLIEDVRLDKDARQQNPGAMSDSEAVSGNYGQARGMSVTEDVEFDKKGGVPSSAPAEIPRAIPETQGMSVLESVAGDNGQGPGVSVQENAQTDQKRDASLSDTNQVNPTISQNTNPAVASSASGPIGGQGSGLSMTEDVKIDHKNGNPPVNQNEDPGLVKPIPGANSREPGLSVSENVQIGHNGDSLSVVPGQPSQVIAGGQNSAGVAAAMPPIPNDPATPGRVGLGPVGDPGTEKGQMNVEAFLADQRGGGVALTTPAPSSGIRSQDSVQVDFDETSQSQSQGGAPAESNQKQGQDIELNDGGSNQQPQVNEPPQDNDIGNIIKISPKAEQVLEEQSKVKLLIPYDGQERGGDVSNAPTVFNDPIGNFGMSNQINSGLALGSAGTQSVAQSPTQGQQQDQPPYLPQDQPQRQPQRPSQSQPQDPLPGQPQNQLPAQHQLPGQRLQGQQQPGNNAGLLGGARPPAPGSGVSGGPAAPQPAPVQAGAKITGDVFVHREPSAGAGALLNSHAANPSRPGYQHAADSRMNASAMTVPKKEGSSKILEQLDARSQFASKVGDEPGTVKTHVQMQEEKLGDKPGTSDLFDDPSALKREMPSENAKALQQQQTLQQEPQGEIIPGRQNVQITSESVSRIIKNPARHRSAISDPSGLDLPELLRPPGFGSNYYPYKPSPTMRTVKPVSPATPQPSVARLAGSIDMKPTYNAAASSGTQTLKAGASERRSIANSAGMGGMNQPSGLHRTERGDLSTKLSETLKMVDNILGPPPFKSKRNLWPTQQRSSGIHAMGSGHPGSPAGRAQRETAHKDRQDDGMGIDLTLLIGDQPEGRAGASAGSSPVQLSVEEAPPAPRPMVGAGRPSAQQLERVRIYDSLKDLAHSKSKGGRRNKHRLKQPPKETKIKDIIEVKTSADDDSSDKTYDYDVSQLPAWMKSHVKSPHQNI